MEVKEPSAKYLTRPRYKQTEVGVIPEAWDTKPLGRLFAFTNGVNAAKESYGKGLRFINVLEPITYSHLYGPEVPGRVAVPEAVARAYAVKLGDVLFNRTSETDAELGLASVFLGTEQVVFGGFVIRGRPTDDSLDPTYSGYALRAPFIRGQIVPMGQGAVRANIGQKNLGLVIAPIPPKREQRAIAAALSDVDALLGGLDRIIAKKRDLKQAAMQQLLTGQTRLPGFHGEWEVKRLGELLTYEQPTKYLVRSSEYSDANDVPVLTAGKTFILGYTNEDDGVFNSLPVIIFDDFTTATKYVTFLFKAKSSAMKLLKPRNPAVNLRLVYEMMQLIEFKLSEHKRYWISEYQKLELKLPEEKEREAIMNVLADMDAELSALEARRDKTRALKQGMMQELLTGRTRLV